MSQRDNMNEINVDGSNDSSRSAEMIAANSVNTEKKTEVNVDEILIQYVGGCGLWQWMITLIAFTANPSMSTLPVFFNAIPSHRCRMEADVEDLFKRFNVSFSEAATLTGPWINDKLLPSQIGCARFQLDWSNQTMVTEIIQNKSSFQTINKTELLTEPCPLGYLYQSTQFQYPNSVVMEFDLVCHKRWLGPMGIALFMCGMFLGFIVGGWAGDRFGRKRTAIVTSLLEMVTLVLISVAPNHHMYHLMRTMIGFTNTSKASVLRILPLELTLAKYRSYFSSFYMFGIIFVHQAAISGWAYLIPKWRYLNAILLLPCSFCLLFFCLLPESPRWLISQSKKLEALKVLRTACYVNHIFSRDKTKLHQLDELISSFKKSNPPINSSNTNRMISSGCFPCKLPNHITRRHMPSVRIRVTIFLSSFVFVCQSLIFLGLFLYARVVRDSVYVVTVINSAMAIPGILLATICYRVSRFRRLPLASIYGLSTGFLFCGGLYTFLAKPQTDVVMTVCSNIVLALYSASQIMVVIYVSELFPSNWRTFAVGIAAGIGRIGGALSTFVNQLDDYSGHGVPLILYAVMGVGHVILVTTLRDTTGENLPDVEATQGGHKGCSSQDPSQLDRQSDGRLLASNSSPSK